MKTTKRWIAACLAVFMLCTAAPCFAEDEIAVTINGSAISFDVPPQIIDGRTMVPMRKIFEQLGASVDWIGELQLILAVKGSKIMALAIGSDMLSITDNLTNETKTVTLDVVPQIVDGRTLVPVRAISQALDMDVEWDAATRTVRIGESAQ